MAAFIIPDDDSGRIIVFDVITDELHENIAEVTEHPVEVGANISDHIRPLPDQFSLTGYVSNQPVYVNPFTQRGETRSIKLDIPTFTPISLAGAINAVGDALSPPNRSVTVLAFPDTFDAIWETYEALREFQTNGVLLQIITTIRVYDDMVITRVAAPRTSGDSGVAFGLDVRKLRVVESGQVAAPPVPADDVPGGKPLENKGGQGGKTPDKGEDPAKSGSIVYNLAKAKGMI